ncbi:MAG: hypothetical protein IKS21_06050 [Oscillospiraceae bacterium]|nr:hypothetical protein [Oscillospiraceae bacterium]
MAEIQGKTVYACKTVQIDRLVLFPIAHLRTPASAYIIEAKKRKESLRKQKYDLTVSTEETRVILRSLIELKNKLIRDGRN